MISIVGLVKDMIGAYIFSIVIIKFYHKKKLCSVILFKIDENLKISFCYTILFFDLAICLKIKRGEKSLLNFNFKTKTK